MWRAGVWPGGNPESHRDAWRDVGREQGSTQDSSSDVGKGTEPKGKDGKKEDEDGQKGQVSVGRQEAMAPTVGYTEEEHRSEAKEGREIGGDGDPIGTEQVHLVLDSLSPFCSQPLGACGPKW